MVLNTVALLAGAKKGIDYWNANKNNKNNFVGGIANKWGNRIQNAINNHVGDGFFKDTLSSLNETVFAPDPIKQNIPKPPVEKSESRNSSNAVYSAGEGSLYGSKPGARNPYDYASTDFEGIIRKQLNAASTPRTKRYRMR